MFCDFKETDNEGVFKCTLCEKEIKATALPIWRACPKLNSARRKALLSKGINAGKKKPCCGQKKKTDTK